MHLVASLLRSYTAIAATQRNKWHLYFSRTVQQRGFWQRNGCRALANRKKRHFRVNRWMLNKVVRMQRNDLVETWNSSWFVVSRGEFSIGWYEKPWLRLSIKVNSRKVLIGPFIWIVATLQIRFQSGSISNWSSVLSGVCRLLWTTNVFMLTKYSARARSINQNFRKFLSKIE